MIVIICRWTLLDSIAFTGWRHVQKQINTFKLTVLSKKLLRHWCTLSVFLFFYCLLKRNNMFHSSDLTYIPYLQHRNASLNSQTKSKFCHRICDQGRKFVFSDKLICVFLNSDSAQKICEVRAFHNISCASCCAWRHPLNATESGNYVSRRNRQRK